LEIDPPAGARAVEWMLLTSIEVASLKQALRCVRWYCRRWRIEEWHRVMKSGCKILEHQNHSAQVLLRAIAIDAVIAWRIMLLALLGREMPELPGDVLFDQREGEVLKMRWLSRIRKFVEGLRSIPRHGRHHDPTKGGGIKTSMNAPRHFSGARAGLTGRISKT